MLQVKQCGGEEKSPEDTMMLLRMIKLDDLINTRIRNKRLQLSLVPIRCTDRPQHQKKLLNIALVSLNLSLISAFS